MVVTGMKVSSLLVVFVVLLSAPAFGERLPSIRAELEADGPASHVRLHRSVNSEPETLLEQAWFDRDGRVTERVAYDEDGEFGRRIGFTYNDDGDLSGWESRDADGELQWRYVYLYDEERRVTQEISYDSHGNMEGTELYSYDDDQLVEEAAYSGDGLPQWRKTYDHDEQSGLVEWAVYFEDGRLLKRGTKFSNPIGRIVRERLRDELEDTFEEIAYSYDHEGRVTRARVNDADGRLRRVLEYEYDEYDNVTRELERDPAGNTVREKRVRYRYDERGNWTERIKTETQQDPQGTETREETRFRREIEYHDE